MLTKQQILEHLSPLPCDWAQSIANVLCEFQSSIQTPDCNKVKECETLTSLSDFVIDGNSVCITYKDENKVSVERCFDVTEILNNSVNDIDSGCVASSTSWNGMSYLEKFQAIIDTLCNCCPSVTTTTTIPASSTTTTTTIL